MDEVKSGVYIGDIQDGRTVDEAEWDITVITLCSVLDESHSLTEKSYIPLNDGENSNEKFNKAIQLTISKIQTETPVLVHCNMGVSRSATILATAISVVYGKSFESSLNDIRDVRPNVNPKPELREQALTYLSSDT